MGRERRPLFQEEELPVEPGRYGCPMLTRGHRAHPVDPNRALLRCSLGWALHGEIDVQRCLLTESVTDCWQIHPERAPLVVLPHAAAPGVDEVEHKASAD